MPKIIYNRYWLVNCLKLMPVQVALQVANHVVLDPLKNIELPKYTHKHTHTHTHTNTHTHTHTHTHRTNMSEQNRKEYDASTCRLQHHNAQLNVITMYIIKQNTSQCKTWAAPHSSRGITRYSLLISLFLFLQETGIYKLSHESMESSAQWPS